MLTVLFWFISRWVENQETDFGRRRTRKHTLMIRHSMTGSTLGPPSDFQKCLPLRSSEIRRSALIAVVAQYTHPRHLLLQSRLTPLCPIPLFISGECRDLYLSQSAAGHGSCFHDDIFHYSYFYEFVAWLELTKTRSSFHWSRHPWRAFRISPLLSCTNLPFFYSW